MVFDGLHYAGCLAHLGRPMLVGSLPFAVLRRSIPGTPYHDFLSTWPYGSAPDGGGLEAAMEELRAAGGGSCTGMVTPGPAHHHPAVAPAAARGRRPPTAPLCLVRRHS